MSCAFATAGAAALGLAPARLALSSRPRAVRRPRAPMPARMDAGEQPPPPPPVAPETSKAKQFATLYGGSYLGTSMAMAVVSYAAWYSLIKAGVDVVAVVRVLGDWLATTPIGRPAVLSRVNESIGTATLAYIAHKATSPLRFPLTLAATPFVARAFSRKSKDGENSGE